MHDVAATEVWVKEVNDDVGLFSVEDQSEKRSEARRSV